MKRIVMCISLIILAAIVAAIAAGVIPVPDTYPWMGTVALLIPLIVFAVIIGFLLAGLNKNKSSQYDERMIKARGDSAMKALVVTNSTILTIGFACTYLPLNLTIFDASVISVEIGLGTFAILADIQDAYLGMKDKRKGFALFFGATGLFILYTYISKLYRNPEAENDIYMLVVGISLLALSIEMFIKMLCDKRAAKLETEDEKS